MPDPSEAGEDVALVAAIRAEIRRDGPMTFARFMDLALYDPAGGYYRSAEARPGRDGDFVTAPELHPIFGATLAGLVTEAWDRLGRPTPFTVREIGAGTGALAEPLLGALAGSPLAESLAYEPLEIDDRRLTALRVRLERAGLTPILERGTHPDRDRPDPDRTIVGIVLANEVLDALPVHRVRMRGGALRELAVGLADGGERLVEVEIDPSTGALAARLADEGVELVEGQTAEICLAIDGWLAGAVEGLARGLLVVIDYGAAAAQLYDPTHRAAGTLRAYVRQSVHDDPYRHVGRQDLTSHVDLTAMAAAAQRAGLSSEGWTTQAEALVGLGLETRLQAIQADPATTLEDYLHLRAAIRRLLDPAAMGGFGVVAFGRDWPAGPPLAMFSFRTGRHPGSPTRDGSRAE